MKKPSLFRRIIMSLVSGWRRVMSVKYNPLKHIPDPSLHEEAMAMNGREISPPKIRERSPPATTSGIRTTLKTTRESASCTLCVSCSSGQ